MISYSKARSILKKAKIKIQDEEILVKNSFNRIVSKDIISKTNNPAADNAAFDGLRITLCGTSSPLPAPGRAQACVAVETPGHLYIIDAGSGSAATAQLSGIPLGKLRGILLTHYHLLLTRLVGRLIGHLEHKPL